MRQKHKLRPMMNMKVQSGPEVAEEEGAAGPEAAAHAVRQALGTRSIVLTGMIDSEEMFDRLFARYRALQILP